MYSLQHHWPVKTFALADSEGKRTRIRRSKEERKTLVESFIKKYQSLNDGKFPSLNLTHKEVGGSFYTVREIVRDVIQENRVLGPAKFSLAEQKIDANSTGTLDYASSTERGKDMFQLAIEVDNKENANMVLDSGDVGQYTKVEVVDAGQFGDGIQSGGFNELTYPESSASINIGVSDNPQKAKTESSLTDVVQSPLHENPDVLNASQLGVSDAAEQTESSSGENVEPDRGFYAAGASMDSKGRTNTEKGLKEDGQCLDHEILNDEHSINEYPEIVKGDEMVSLDSPAEAIKEPVVAVEASAANITDPTADVAVETFPLRYGTMDRVSDVGVDDLKDPCRTSQKLETGGAGLDNNGALNSRTDPSDSVEQKAEGSLEFPVSDRRDEVAEHTRPAIVNTTSDSQEASTLKEASAVAIGEQKVNSAEMQWSKSTNQSLKTEKHEVEDPSDSQQVSGGPAEQLVLSKKVAVNGGSADNVVDQKVNNQTSKGRNPTLDRINLESWEGKKSKKNSSEEPEKNPLVTFLKALVDGFLKFWSETE